MKKIIALVLSCAALTVFSGCQLMQDSAKSLRQEIDKGVNTATEFKDGVVDQANDLQKQVRDTKEALQNTSEDIQKQAEEAQKALDEKIKQLDEAGQKINDAQQAIDQAADSVKKINQ
jgi:peptidoglycan hydrolase CwlO-like protein